MTGLLNTAAAAVMTLALVTAPPPSVQAETVNEWIPQVSDVIALVYCIIGTGSCDGLEPGADMVDFTSDNQAVCAAGGGTWANNACTSNLATVCTAAGGTWANNACTPAASGSCTDLANGVISVADCAQLGGTGNPGDYCVCPWGIIPGGVYCTTDSLMKEICL